MKLKRIADTGDATFGVLLGSDGVPFAVTLEEPWRDNQHSISCIPLGSYACKRFHSVKHPNTFEITGVPNRQAILFHTGNSTDDTEGCVLIGEQYAVKDGAPSIAVSRDAFAEFMARCDGYDTFTLEIVAA